MEAKTARSRVEATDAQNSDSVSRFWCPFLPLPLVGGVAIHFGSRCRIRTSPSRPRRTVPDGEYLRFHATFEPSPGALRPDRPGRLECEYRRVLLKCDGLSD